MVVARRPRILPLIEVDLLVAWAGLTGTIAGWMFGIAALFRVRTLLSCSFCMFHNIAIMALLDSQID